MSLRSGFSSQENVSCTPDEDLEKNVCMFRTVKTRLKNARNCLFCVRRVYLGVKQTNKQTNHTVKAYRKGRNVQICKPTVMTNGFRIVCE